MAATAKARSIVRSIRSKRLLICARTRGEFGIECPIYHGINAYSKNVAGRLGIAW